MKYLVFPFISFLFVACFRPDYTQEIGTLQQMQEQVSALDSSLAQQMQRHDLDSMYAVLNSDLAFFKDAFNQDNRAQFREDIAWISNYRSIRKLASGYGENAGRLSQEIALSKSQLKTLLADLEKGAFEKEQVSTFLKTEDHAIGLINKSLAALDSNQTEFVKNFEWMKPKIDSIRMKLK